MDSRTEKAGSLRKSAVPGNFAGTIRKLLASSACHLAAGRHLCAGLLPRSGAAGRCNPGCPGGDRSAHRSPAYCYHSAYGYSRSHGHHRANRNAGTHGHPHTDTGAHGHSHPGANPHSFAYPGSRRANPNPNPHAGANPNSSSHRLADRVGLAWPTAFPGRRSGLGYRDR